MTKLERSAVKYPLWRKKVDSSLFQHKGTTIPNWACKTWGINKAFSTCSSKNNPRSKVYIYFSNRKYPGNVTCAKQKRVNPAYRLWFDDHLLYDHWIPGTTVYLFFEFYGDGVFEFDRDPLVPEVQIDDILGVSTCSIGNESGGTAFDLVIEFLTPIPIII